MKTFKATHVDGEHGQLDVVLTVRAVGVVDAGKRLGRAVGKLGLFGVYLAQHRRFGWGQWFVVSNSGVNATYKLEEVSQ